MMSERSLAECAVRFHLSLRRRIRRLRAIAWASHPCFTIARGVQIGRGLRLRAEPGGRIELAEGCEIDDGATLAVARGGLLRIGEAAFVGHHSTLAARSEVRIGARTFLAELVSVRDHDHDPAHPPSTGTTLIDPVYVGDDCWLATKVTVTRGVTIGNHVVVGAHAVVTRDLPSDVLAVGVPARVIENHADRS